jgi:hypothetical protein
MFSAEESPRIKTMNGSYMMHYSEVYNEELPFREYVSDQVVVNQNELDQMLQKYNYFQPR